MNSAEMLAFRQRLEQVVIDESHKGDMIQEDGMISKLVGGVRHSSTLEIHERAVKGRLFAARLLAAADNMDRVVQEALDAKEASS